MVQTVGLVLSHKSLASISIYLWYIKFSNRIKCIKIGKSEIKYVNTNWKLDTQLHEAL